MRCLLLNLFIFSFAFIVAQPGEKLVTQNINTTNISSAIFGFTENKGQVFGTDGLFHPEVKFAFQQGNTQIFLLENGIAYQFSKTIYPEGYSELLLKQDGKSVEKLRVLQKLIRTETCRMDMTLKDANPKAQIIKEGKSSDYTNFYSHNALNVYHYSKITYQEVYPGIDWVIYVKEDGSIKYDFVVKPFADESQIKMTFSHHEKLDLNDDGSFTIKNSMGSISEKKPISFQEGKKVTTKFVLNKNTLSFETSFFERNKDLIIDPSISWATYYGGSSQENGYSCATDVAGNVYLAGSTSSSNSIASAGHQITFGAARDAFLVKFNSSGARLWATYYGGSGLDDGFACCVDGSGNVYLAGATESSTGIASGGFQNAFIGNTNAFLVKFNSSGVRQWATYYGNSIYTDGKGCAVDGSGNVYLSGSTSSSSGISSGGHQNGLGGQTDSYLVKFNTSGVRLWGTYYGGATTDIGYACSTDGSSNVYLTGYTDSNNGISSSGHQAALGGGNDAFLVKFNSSGVRQWGTYYGGTFGDDARNCATDASGNVFLIGSTSSTASIASGGHQNTNAGNNDAFLVKFNSSGVRQWGTYYGGTATEQGYASFTDAVGNVYICGVAGSTINIASGGYQNTLGGGTFDAFLVMFTGSGIRQWGSYYGGTGDDYGFSGAVDNGGDIFLAGLTSSTLNIAYGGFQNSFAGGYDAFLTKLSNKPAKPASIYGNTVVCSGTSQTYSVIVDPSATSYSWSIPFGWTGTSVSNSITLNVGLSGTLSVTASNSFGTSQAATLAISVNPSPLITVNSGTICSGQSFTLQPSGALTFTYQGGTAVVSPSSTSTYTIVGTSSLGCVSQSAAVCSVTVHPNPIIIVNNGAICSGAIFTLIPNGASTYTFSSGSNTVNPTSTNSYSVTGTSSLGCVSATPAISNVTVYPLPILVVSTSNSIICVGETALINALGATNYTWSAPISISAANATSITSTPSITTTYTLNGSDDKGCENMATITQSVSECTGEDLQVKNESLSFKVYPNPNNGQFIIEAYSPTNIKIVNILGELILSKDLLPNRNEINLSEFEKGVYFVVAVNSNTKLVIQ